MVVIWAIAWMISAIYAGVEQIRYAKLNYPNSLTWRLRLFASGFGAGALLIVVLVVFSNNTDLWQTIMIAFATGVVSGLGSVFLLPHNMQGWYPKQRNRE